MGHHRRMEMLKSGDHLPPVTSLAGLAALAGPRVAGLIPAGDGAACVDSAPPGHPARLEVTEMSICVRVSVLGVGCVCPAAPGYTCGGGCVCGWVSFVFTESLASAKEENVGIHQVLDQTLLELNNL
ncbi:tropomyosin beta chain-like [Limosa lapponica baueri]|uniref:Tropomyosin beta chain-like n=1 Tax=Limosa lapponica baueri TaxID=1758121 RepID=A0A2I0U9U5_LIMLA|nr:tropomyosin beta chain-like [Limosa lapponica baueri]